MCYAGQYITQQPFLEAAREGEMTPRKVAEALNEAKKTDPQLRELNAQLAQAQQQKSQARSSTRYPANMPAIMACDNQIEAATSAMRTRTEALCGEVAQKKDPARPGGGP